MPYQCFSNYTFSAKAGFLKLVIAFVMFVLYFSSCRYGTSALETALDMAGDNRIELEKVLTKYAIDPGDSLKYRSAVFLIENMPRHFYFVGKGIADYTNYFKALRDSRSVPTAILDSIAGIYGDFSSSRSQTMYDIQTVDSAYLCENIELAFGAWRDFPWSRQYDFDEFREFILPYRIGNESLTDWRSIFLKEYSSLIDGLDLDDPIEVATSLRLGVIERLGDPRFTMTRPAGYPALDALTSRQLAGACDDLTQFTISLFRAFGIACSEDVIPIRGDSNFGHSWVALFDHNGDVHNSDFFDEILYVSETMANRAASKAKVYRNTFSTNVNEFDRLKSHGVSIPGRILDLACHSVDVTACYSNNLIDLHVPKQEMYSDVVLPPIAFLCAPSWLEWKPVAWSEVMGDGGIAFKDVDAGSILRIACFDEAEIRFLTPPFFVHKQSRKLIFIPDADSSKVSDATLYSKFSAKRDEFYSTRLLNGCFEGADNPRFTDPDTLHIIEETPHRLFTEVSVTVPNGYSYLRYRGPRGSHCNIAEIEFYSDTVKLHGEPIGTAGTWNDRPNSDHAAAFDGRTETSFNHLTASKGWTGIRLSHPKRVTKIRYAPRNTDNYIKKGDDYGLFVSTRDGWKLFDEQTAESDSLVFRDAPVGALLYLKNYTGGTQERVFLMKGERQVFK